MFVKISWNRNKPHQQLHLPNVVCSIEDPNHGKTDLKSSLWSGVPFTGHWTNCVHRRRSGRDQVSSASPSFAAQVNSLNTTHITQNKKQHQSFIVTLLARTLLRRFPLSISRSFSISIAVVTQYPVSGLFHSCVLGTRTKMHYNTVDYGRRRRRLSRGT